MSLFKSKLLMSLMVFSCMVSVSTAVVIAEPAKAKGKGAILTPEERAKRKAARAARKAVREKKAKERAAAKQ